MRPGLRLVNALIFGLGFAVFITAGADWVSGESLATSPSNDSLQDEQVDPSSPPKDPTAKTPPPSDKSINGQVEPRPGGPTSDELIREASNASDPPEQTTTVASPGPKDPRSYGLWVLLPAGVAILLAIVSRQVIPALVLGVFMGAYMMVPCLSLNDPFAQSPGLIAGFRIATERYVLGALIDPKDGFGHAKIILFTLIIGFAIGVIGRNGGTAGMVQLVVGRTESTRRGTLTAWLAGMVVFFDDYANTMIIGPTMAPVFDRLRISRAKLAYIIDSTAAPVASLAIIGTWIGAEISYIDQGLEKLAATGGPAFLEGMNGMGAFLQSLPYRFYPMLAIVLVFLVCLLGRDFGPMRKSQDRALSQPEEPQSISGRIHVVRKMSDGAVPRWWLGFIPIAVLVGSMIVVLTLTGMQSEATRQAMKAVDADGHLTWSGLSWWQKSSEVIRNSDAYLSIFHGAVLAALVAVILTVVARACPTRAAVDAGLDGMARMFPAIVILILAWAVSHVLQDLALGEVVKAKLEAGNFSAHRLPLAVFVCSALVSFATGTSWATMGILTPVAVQIGAGLVADLPPAEGSAIFFETVGSVLAGSIFGDHCSPISDTTVLSSIASGCPHEEHVWTQIPYALLAVVVSIVVSEVVCRQYSQPWYVGLGVGAVVLFLFVVAFGRPPRYASQETVGQ